MAWGLAVLRVRLNFQPKGKDVLSKKPYNIILTRSSPAFFCKLKGCYKVFSKNGYPIHIVLVRLERDTLDWFT